MSAPTSPARVRAFRGVVGFRARVAVSVADDSGQLVILDLATNQFTGDPKLLRKLVGAFCVDRVTGEPSAQ